MAYTRGSSVRSTATFTVASVATDPTTVVLRVKAPRRETLAYQFGVGSVIVKSATGVFYSDVTLDLGGTWVLRWEGTGNCVAATETELSVDRGGF